MDDIAERARISKALLYQHFPTKRSLYIASLDEIVGPLLATVTGVDRSLAPNERVRQGLDRYLDYISANPRWFRSLMHAGIGDDKAVASMKEQFRRRLVEDLLADSPFAKLEDPRVELAARGWVGFVEATSAEWCVSQSVPREELRELLTQMLFEALKHVATRLRS